MTEPRPLVRVRGLKKNYPRQRVDAPLHARLLGKLWGWTGALDEWDKLNEGLPVLKGIDLDIVPDETLAIVGRSGAGKSTLLHLIGALDRPTEGSVIYEDRDLGALPAAELDAWRNRTVGYVFQFYHLFPDLNALENVLVPAQVAYSVPAYLGKRAELTERAERLLAEVNLADRRHHRPSQLSGGEQQRVAIARALLLQPKLLLCDEPTGNLDRRTGEGILEMLWKLKAESGQTYVIVTHDERLAAKADRVARMEDGKLVGVKSPAEWEAEDEAAAGSGRAAAPEAVPAEGAAGAADA
jgi:lipoprotein-releasing system ATP-binding protein